MSRGAFLYEFLSGILKEQGTLVSKVRKALNPKPLNPNTRVRTGFRASGLSVLDAWREICRRPRTRLAEEV